MFLCFSIEYFYLTKDAVCFLKMTDSIMILVVLKVISA